MLMKNTILASLLTTAAVGVLIAQDPPPAQPPQQIDTVKTVITGGPGLPPKLAVPDFIPLGGDPDTVAAAKLLGQVLWDDLNFEREFYLISRDTYRTIPRPTSFNDVPLDRWKELGTDGLVVGTVRREGKNLVVQVKLVEVNSGRSAFAKEYSGSSDNPRFFAHTISDEIHMEQRNLRGVARTKLAFTSNRDGERMTGPTEARSIQNIYMSDYDGARQTRVTITKSLDITPVWAPDTRAIAYTSYRSGFPDIIVADIFGKRTNSTPAHGTPESHNFLPAWSPDGSRLAFMSNRHGNPEIYVMNLGSKALTQITNHFSIDTEPTWSADGGTLYFTSDRGGQPQVYKAPAGGGSASRVSFQGSYNASPTVSYDGKKIATAQGAGNTYRIAMMDSTLGSARWSTLSPGSLDESPSFAPNGAMIIYAAREGGRGVLYAVSADGRVRQRLVLAGGDVREPAWGPFRKP